ncbi:MAG: class I SAM-dependent methyltransferase [Beijerinckiaceae bacterium]|nr:class I SAM-dependent methyltransferase [Beijerinckiaceae bacterium]
MATSSADRAQHYDKAFFEGFADVSQRSAGIVLGRLLDQFRPASMLDVGCGVGTWLKAAEGLGIAGLRGLDGPWVSADQLRIPAEAFERIDFEAPDWPEIRPVDLAISLEVAEHLSPEAGDRLVRYLCRSAPVVLFSAAIPNQGGEGHRNEQWQSYWAERFARDGYVPRTALRSAVWADDRVEFWYQQNMILYVAESHASQFPAEAADAMIDAIHPRLYHIRVIKREKRRNRWKRFLPFLRQG